jgi:hypothetical protein
MWITNSSAYAPTVNYGLSPSTLVLNATGTTGTYVASQLCGISANTTGCAFIIFGTINPALIKSIYFFRTRGGFMNPGQIHDVLLTGLAPDTQYFYQVGLCIAA